MANNINVKITADIVDLRSKLALANAELGATQKQLKGLAAEAASGGTKTVSADLLKAAEASAQAESKVSLLKGEIKKFGAEASKIGHGHTGFLRYIREVFDEVSSGRTRYLPSTLATLAQQYGGLSTAALGAVGAVAALAAGLGYLEYKSLEAKKEVDDLTTAFRLTGRGGEIGAGGVQYMLDFLNSVPNASSAATQAFVQFAATSGDVNLVLANQVGQLLPAFEKAYGKKAPEAAEKLLKSLSNLSVDGFRKLDQDLLNLSPKEYEQVEHLISIGDQAKAAAEIMAILAHRTGTYVGSLGDQVDKIEKSMTTVVKNAAFRDGIHLNFDPKSIQSIENAKKILASQGGWVSQSAISDLDELEKKLRAVRALEAKNAKAQADHNYKTQVQSAEKLNESLDQQGKIKTHLLALEKDLSEAEKRGDKHGIATFTKSISIEEEKLKKLQQEMAHQKAHAAFSGTGFGNAGAEEIAQAHETISQINADQALGDAERKAEIEATYRQLLASDKLNAAQRLAVETELNKALATNAKQSAREQEQIAQEHSRTAIELARLAYQQKKAELDKEVAAGRISKEQEVQDLTKALQQIETLQLAAVDQSIIGYDKDTLAYARAQDEKKLIVARTNAEIKQLQAKLTQDLAKDQNSTVKTIEQAEHGLVQGFLTGSQTISALLGNLAVQTAQRWINSELDTLTNHIFVQNAKTKATATGVAQRSAIETSSNSTLISRMFHTLAEWLGIETAKTSATVTGAAIRTTAEKVANKESASSGGAAASASILKDAGKAAAATYAAVAEIPAVGPFLAPEAAAAAYTAVLAFDTIASAEGGQWQVPYDGQLTMLHRNEMVIPANIANPMRSAVESMGSSRSPTARGGVNNVAVHFHINALDGASVGSFFDANKSRIARLVVSEMDKNMSMRPSY